MLDDKDLVCPKCGRYQEVFYDPDGFYWIDDGKVEETYVCSCQMCGTDFTAYIQYKTEMVSKKIVIDY